MDRDLMEKFFEMFLKLYNRHVKALEKNNEHLEWRKKEFEKSEERRQENIAHAEDSKDSEYESLLKGKFRKENILLERQIQNLKIDGLLNDGDLRRKVEKIVKSLKEDE
jgi:hypothetical protein